ncbi:hypothetical protein [Sinorhizobium meliloti]|uniref:hypothetical protein n=1 Tax=Rhizobium meliloti TaxID=382 RepID=UPI000FE02EA1|nr:hypothetical protein [Sinorhizobium meliloti]RVM57854.1 hypothetical protein CN124_29355 [Sinorhizobium meliloti]
MKDVQAQRNTRLVAAVHRHGRKRDRWNFSTKGRIGLFRKQKVDVAAALVYEWASILCLPIFVLLRFARLLTNFPLSKVETPLCVAQR